MAFNAAVPPLSGFWAKGDVLENAWSARPALWAVGIVTAALTAYYMSRLSGLAFFGRDRWSDTAPLDAQRDMVSDHHAPSMPIPEPHESGWVMTVPLYVLAFLAAVGGVLVASNVHFSLSNWIDPVFGGNLYNNHLSTGDLWVLGTIDGVIAFVGVFVGLRIWVRRADHPALEPVFLRAAWLLNELYDAVFGRPSERLAAFSAEVVESRVIDGTVNGIGAAASRTGTMVRRVQTGYVRNYVLGIVLGGVLMLAFMLTRLWWT